MRLMVRHWEEKVTPRPLKRARKSQTRSCSVGSAAYVGCRNNWARCMQQAELYDEARIQHLLLRQASMNVITVTLLLHLFPEKTAEESEKSLANCSRHENFMRR